MVTKSPFCGTMNKNEMTLDSLRRDADEVGARAIMWVDAEKIKPTL